MTVQAMSLSTSDRATSRPELQKILVTAYACEPGLGSEAGIGWGWTREIAQRYDCWLVTRENNVAAVRARATELGLDRLRVIGFDLPAWARFWKRGERGALPYFWLWQWRVAKLARSLDREHDFDLVQHLTFASDWIPSGLAAVGKPFVWGPVGRHPRVPAAFLGVADGRARRGEGWKAATKGFLTRADRLLHRTWKRADLILYIGSAFERNLPRFVHHKTLPFLACGTVAEELPADRFERGAGFEVLFAGRLVDLKGVRLALDAFARLHAEAPTATLTFVGDGPLRGALEARAQELGVAHSVQFTGHVELSEVWRRMRSAQVFLFPSFEGAGMVVPEAMIAGNPVVCLDFGGPADMVTDATGIKVPLGATFEQTAEGLGRALIELEGDERRRARLARGAHAWAVRETTWEAKGERLEALYTRALEHFEASA